MSNENNNEIELSPGFFDLNNPNNDGDDINEISNLIPEKINVENVDDNNNAKNVVIEFFTLMIFNTNKSCDCDESGWSRTSTY